MGQVDDIRDECSLDGVIEMHLHADPDSPSGWWADDKASLLEQYRAQGCRAVLFIGNDWPTHREAFLLTRRIPGIEVFGGLSLSFCHGPSLNRLAVERCLNDAAAERFRCVWLPTGDSAFDRGKKGLPGLAVLDSHGRVLPEVLDIMAICRDAGIMLGTGHAGPEAAPLLAEAAKRVGLEKLVITQSTLQPRALSLEQARICLDRGAYLEHVMLAAFKGAGHTLVPAHQSHGHMPVEAMARFLSLAPERQFIATDMDQSLNPHPLAAMRLFLRGLKEAGLSRESLLDVSRRVPARLLGLPL